MLKRGVGEHNAKLGQVARDGRCEYEGVGRIAVVPANSPPAQQHDGADTASEQIAFSIVDMTQALGISKTTYHDGKWFVAAAFATAQLGHRLLVGSVTG